jgi:hypothetical protein
LAKNILMTIAVGVVVTITARLLINKIEPLRALVNPDQI